MTRSRELTEALLEPTPAHPEWGFSLWGLSAAAWGQFVLGQLTMHVGNLETARAQIEQGVELARRYDDTETEGWALTWLGAAADLAGDVESGLGPCQRAVEIAERIGSPYSRAVAYYRLGILGCAVARAADRRAAGGVSAANGRARDGLRCRAATRLRFLQAREPARAAKAMEQV